MPDFGICLNVQFSCFDNNPKISVYDIFIFSFHCVSVLFPWKIIKRFLSVWFLQVQSLWDSPRRSGKGFRKSTNRKDCLYLSYSNTSSYINLFPFYPKISDEHRKVEELNHFLHYYSRFKNHENSYKVSDWFSTCNWKISQPPGLFFF